MIKVRKIVLGQWWIVGQPIHAPTAGRSNVDCMAFRAATAGKRRRQGRVQFSELPIEWIDGGALGRHIVRFAHGRRTEIQQSLQKRVGMARRPVT